MKKIIITMMTGILAVSLLAGCGKTTEEKQEESFMNEIVNEIESAMEEFSSEIATTATADTSSYKKFDSVSEWNDTDPSDRAVQIDDVLYKPGISVPDFIDLVDSSSISYEYDYNADALVMGNDSETIAITRNGSGWFSATATNPTEDTATIAECVITDISILNNTYEFCHFIDGRSYDDILAMTYSDVKNTMEKIFPDYQLEEKRWEYDGENVINMYYTGEENAKLINNTEWSGYLFSKIPTYNFYISKETNSTVGFLYDGSIVFLTTYKIPDLVTSEDELTSAEIKDMSAWGKEIAESCEFEYESVTEIQHSVAEGPYKSISYGIDYKMQFYNYYMLFEITHNDKPTTYTIVICKNLERDNGELVFNELESGWIALGAESIEQAIESAEFRGPVFDY